MLRQKLVLLILLILPSHTSCIGRAYIDTAKFVNDRPAQTAMTAFQVEVTPFESQLQDRSRVGTKRVGTSTISGPILATQDPVSVAQQGVITQLRKKGIVVGSSPLQLRGTVRNFFVDVDVNPASGRGKFNALVTVDLAVWNAKSRQQIWHETYTSKATASAPSVLDSAYEKALRIAFTNLMTKLQQDDSILDVKHIMGRPRPTPPLPPPPSKERHPPKAPTIPRKRVSDTTPPQVVVLESRITKDSKSTKVSVTGIAAASSGMEEIQANGNTAEMVPASEQETQAAGLTGKAVRFDTEFDLEKGTTQVEITAHDRDGNAAAPRMVMLSDTK